MVYSQAVCVEDLVPEKVARHTATYYYPYIFKKLPMDQKEYWKTVHGIRGGKLGHYRIQETENPDQVIWRVMIRGHYLVALYSRGQRIILRFLEGKEFKKYLTVHGTRRGR